MLDPVTIVFWSEPSRASQIRVVRTIATSRAGRSTSTGSFDDRIVGDPSVRTTAGVGWFQDRDEGTEFRRLGEGRLV